MVTSANFDLHLQAADSGRTAVQVIQSPAGETPQPALAPSAALASLQPLSAPLTDVNGIGRALWRSTLGLQPVAELWWASLATVGVDGLLRLRLLIDDPSLAALSWELLHDDARTGFLAPHGGTPVVCYLRLPFAALPRPADRPLRLEQELQAEVAKGKEADDGRMATLLNGLLKLAPGAVGAAASIFATPVLSGLAGEVTKLPPMLPGSARSKCKRP